MDARPGSRNGWAMRTRDQFEDLRNEHPVAAIIRALGLMETTFHNRNGSLIANDGFEGKYWQEIWHAVSNLLATDLGNMDGGTLSTMLSCLAINAGWSESEVATW